MMFVFHYDNILSQDIISQQTSYMEGKYDSFTGVEGKLSYHYCKCIFN